MTSDLRAQLQSALGAAYTIERELGGGGMSRVFVATETTLGRKVVVKVLPPDLAAELSVERFRREIQVAAKLQNPHIVPLLSAGEGNGLLYYTMPYVEGESLRGRLARDGELPVAAAVQVMRDVLKALAYAHRHGVIHRDIKPENILFSEGEALVADFGVAKALSASTASGGGGLTSVGLALGTPAYMAPEQAAADVSVDARADLYALGAVAYEMLTGSALFPGRSPQALIVAHTIEAPEAIDRRRPNLSPPLASLVMRLLSKRPADRPQTADDALREIEAMGVIGGTGMSSIPLVPLRANAWRRARVPLAAAAVALIAAGITLAVRARGSHPAAAPTAAADEASIAVLPFVSMSGDKENQYFSDGLTEELIDRLANIRGLRVAARTSSFALTKGVDAPEIGRLLHVRHIVEGSVRRSGSRIRVTAQLIEADSGYHRWSHTYDGDLKDVFAVQQQIGTAIAAELQLALTKRDSALLARAPTVDTAAHRLYLEGLYYTYQRSASSIPRAISAFTAAIARDPSYADAHAGLAIAYSVLPYFVDLPIDSIHDEAVAAAHTALSLDSTLSTAHDALMELYAERWEWDAAVREGRHAIALSPNDPIAHHWLGYILASTGPMDEAVRLSRRAVELDPLSVIIRNDLVAVLFAARRDEEAEVEAQKVVQLAPNFPNGLIYLGEILVIRGHPDSAVRLARQAVALDLPEPFAGNLGTLGFIFALAGQRDSALAVERLLEARAKRGYVSPAATAVIELWLGHRDQAVAGLARAIDIHDAFVGATFPFDRMFDSLRADPRFADLKRRMNLR